MRKQIHLIYETTALHFIFSTPYYEVFSWNAQRHIENWGMSVRCSAIFPLGFAMQHAECCYLCRCG